MNAFNKILLMVIVVLFAFACDGDYRQQAVGAFGDAVVLMDSTEHDSQTAEAIRRTYGQGIQTLPNYEALFDLRFVDFRNNEQLEVIKKNKNLIIAATIDDSSNVGRFVRALLDDQVESRVREGQSFAFPLEDQWYRNQWSIILTSTSDSALAENIRNTKESLVESLMEKEFRRWQYDIYDRGENYALEDTLWENHGWKVRVQHDWRKNIDTSYVANGSLNNLVTMRRPLPDNDRWFWAWWQDSVRTADYIDADWINTKRDSLMEKWIRGTRDSSYVTTEYRRPVETDTLRVNGHLAFETLGTWRMTNDAMGGPFANMTIYDEETDRLFILEFGQFAPRYNKRRFVRQFRAMLRTFESDSAWSTGNTMEQNMVTR
ncbi:DUF4837 family protein [Balneolaceae bacterium YR4-1]|uniref:DUF4837 family protein n=1 Tax=Halalkalibaculum roseum TaxID=2709311 RepID=A0A6M1SMI3_9BACT|nr:DUF4837 family protein [Halalkalibaculum roseum]NGP76239.1 DUF4837 family protein [Halalkalibaculum roseum]